MKIMRIKSKSKTYIFVWRKKVFKHGLRLITVSLGTEKFQLFREKLRVCLVCISIFCFYFQFSFSKNFFHFQKNRIMKTCLIWFFVFCFRKIKTLKIYDILTSYLCVFLDLVKIIFFVIWSKMRFLTSIENTENEILLFSFSGCFLFLFSLKMF